MKCNNCGFENNNSAVFCGNCGTKIVQDLQHNDKNQFVIPPSSKKKYSKKLILGIGIILIIAIGIVVVFNKSQTFEDPFENIDNLEISEISIPKKGMDETDSFTKKLEEDYLDGNITADDYIMQLAYSIYDVNKLQKAYRNSKIDFVNPSKLIEKFENLMDDLSDETIKYILEKYTLSNVEWDVKEEQDTSPSVSDDVANKITDYEVRPLINENFNVSKLSNVILSSNDNFLIYYSKEGTNAITDLDAQKIAVFLESVVTEYKNKYNLDFHYDAQLSESVLGTVAEVVSMGLFHQSTTKASQLLKENNIDTEYLNSAMPVFIIDTDEENTNALGYYVPPISNFDRTILKIGDIYSSYNSKIDNMITTYSFPFFAVSSKLSDFDDTKIVLAHELFHHYQKYICGDGEYKDCSSGNFTIETTANQAAIQAAEVNKTGTAINFHACSYVNDVESSLDKIGYQYSGNSGIGYGAFIFATNYSEIVNNGSNNMFNSMKTPDTLKYIYDNSNGKYKDVLITTAKKNLTLEYENKLLISECNGEVIYPPNHEEIKKNSGTVNESIDYSSMHYYYVNPNDYSSKSQIVFNSNSNDLTLLLFVLENTSYKYLYTHNLNSEFVINMDDFSNYQEVVFAIVDSSISGGNTYRYEIDPEGKKTPTVTAESLNLENLKEKIDNNSTFLCHSIDENEDHRTFTQVKLSFDKNDKVNDMYFKGTIQMKNYDPDDPKFALAQKIVIGLIHIMEKDYEEQFKNYKVITKEEKDRFSVTFQITKDFYNALKDGMGVDATTKYDIIKSIQADGYTCNYQQ